MHTRSKKIEFLERRLKQLRELCGQNLTGDAYIAMVEITSDLNRMMKELKTDDASKTTESEVPHVTPAPALQPHGVEFYD